MTKSRKPDRSGIEFMYMHEGEWIDINHVLHPKFTDFVERACGILANIGVTEIITLGITYNRLMRGADPKPDTTSKHAYGLWPGYKAWGDGQGGARAIDITCVEFKDGKRLYVSVASDRRLMVEFCEALGATVHHRKVGSVNPDHLHIEV